jgi:hypothetical protein
MLGVIMLDSISRMGNEWYLIGKTHGVKMVVCLIKGPMTAEGMAEMAMAMAMAAVTATTLIRRILIKTRIAQPENTLEEKTTMIQKGFLLRMAMEPPVQMQTAIVTNCTRWEAILGTLIMGMGKVGSRAERLRKILELVISQNVTTARRATMLSSLSGNLVTAPLVR